MELRAGGDPYRSEKPEWSAGDMRQWPKQKMDRHPVSPIGVFFLTCSKSAKYEAAIQGAATQRAAIQGAAIKEAAIQGATIQEAAIQGTTIQEATIQVVGNRAT